MIVQAALLTMAVGLSAQATGLPTFNAPYRAFEKFEFGAILTIPSNALAIEGEYRLGYKQFDIGFRGGVINPEGAADALAVLGVEARARIITHSQDFPVDGAIITGLGYQFGDADRVVLPVGLSLGRRLTIEDSEVSIVPYVQPTLYWFDFDNVEFSFGLGADFRLSPRFDARVTAGLGDIEGFSFAAVWVR